LTRLKRAFAAFFSILFGDEVPAAPVPSTAAPETRAPQPAAAAAGDPFDRAIQLLALLQRDGRLVDFLMEDLAKCSDEEIGAAVRDVHSKCRDALARYVALEPILAGKEGGPTNVAPDVDPAAVRLVGNVTKRPPFPGTLLHCGWRATRVELPPLSTLTGRRIVAPAEVEVP
jgi:hypothetical protein